MVSLLAAALLGACAWCTARALIGAQSAAPAWLRTRRGWAGGPLEGRAAYRGRSQVWLSQAGAAVTPRQFCAVSAAF
ncbi:MAG TPA: hypothetical protein VME46_08665, partial [Acidimicrobiales bacterium]|nr:hypothetical protein [Acidimicrobiales bacterium]